MSTNFWDAKLPDDEGRSVKQEEVELVEKQNTKQSDKIHFPNSLKIEIDGRERDFFIENQAMLSNEAINAIRSSNEFWIVDIDDNRNAFFQMHIESGLIEYWTDGAMQSQQTGDIDDALKYLESIFTTGSFSQIAKVEVNDNPISSSSEIVPTQQRIDAMQQIDVAQLESVETPSTKYSLTGNTRRDLDNKENMQTVMKGIFALILVPILFVVTIGIFIVVGALLEIESGTYYDDYEMPNRWCDYSVNYPVTVPLTVVGETSMDGYEHNREDGTYSDANLVTNGGICTYRYRTGDSRAFEFVYELEEVSDIDGISMLVMPHPGGQTVGYSGLEVYTMTDNSSEWVLQIDSPYMYGDYERYASYDNYPDGFYYGEWFRHAFDNTVENVSVVKIITGNADQLGDRSVSFSGLRVDAAGDYDYPDYLICSGEWDGLFENSTSDMIAWDPDGC